MGSGKMHKGLYTEKGREGRRWRRLHQPGGGKRLPVSSRPFGLGRALLSLLLTPVGPVVYTAPARKLGGFRKKFRHLAPLGA